MRNVDGDVEKADDSVLLAWLPHAPVCKYRPPCRGNNGRSMPTFVRSAATRSVSAASLAFFLSSLPFGRL